MRSAELDPGQYWNTLRRRKWWVISSVIAGLVAALALNTFTTPIYRATTRVEIQRTPTRSALTGEVLQENTAQSENMALYTTAELITNRVLLTDVVRELSARGVVLRDPERSNPLRFIFGGPATASVSSSPPKSEVDWLLSRVSVEPVKDTRLVNINVEHWNAGAAEQIANTLAQAFAQHHAQEASSGSSSLVAYLTTQLNQTRAEIQAREAQIGSAGAAGQSARQMQLAQGIGELRRELLRVESEISHEREVYKEQHPKIVALQSQRESIERTLAANERELAGLNVRVARSSTLEEDLRGRREFYELLETKLRDAQVTGQMLNPLIQIVEPATANRNPIRPRRALNLGLCLLAGLTVGTGLAFMREGLNRTIRTPQDVSEQLQLPVLGLIRKGV